MGDTGDTGWQPPSYDELWAAYGEAAEEVASEYGTLCPAGASEERYRCYWRQGRGGGYRCRHEPQRPAQPDRPADIIDLYEQAVTIIERTQRVPL